jgi:hypothetical protein
MSLPPPGVPSCSKKGIEAREEMGTGQLRLCCEVVIKFIRFWQIVGQIREVMSTFKCLIDIITPGAAKKLLQARQGRYSDSIFR